MNILEDISALTTLPKFTVQKIFEKEESIICHDIAEELINSHNSTTVNIGIGELCISWDDEEVRYKFIPSRTLEKNIVDTILTGESPLISSVEEALKTRIASVYKDLF